MKKSENESMHQFLLRVKYSTIMNLMKLNVGDVVKIMTDIDDSLYTDIDVESLFLPRAERWAAKTWDRDGYHRPIYEGKDITLLYRVKEIIEGIPYVEPIPVPGFDQYFDINDYEHGNLLTMIDSLIYGSYVFDSDQDTDEDDLEIEEKANNLSMAVVLDEDFADSIVLEKEYIPYESSLYLLEEHKDKIAQAEKNRIEEIGIIKDLLEEDKEDTLSRIFRLLR